MCGRFTLTKPVPWLQELLGMRNVGNVPARYNIAPGTLVPIVRASEGGKRELALTRWGLVPFWAKDPGFGARAINARSETAAEKPAFRSALRYHRCLIPADGFYEWPIRGRRKQPYFVCLKGQTPFAFAGLWESWTSPDGSVLETCTILTGEAEGKLKKIHPRVPIILPKERHGAWLDKAENQTKQVLPLLRPFPDGEMDVRPVSPRVNDVRNDGPECLAGLETTASQQAPQNPDQPSLFGDTIF